MSRSQTRTPDAKGPAETAPSRKPASQDTFRETVESIVVAFVLAFLFRTFIAEAFVIPTGSMAPTLFGRHKDVTCHQCGLAYEVGSSVEMNGDGNLLLGRIESSVCPNCRYSQDIEDLLSFKGDRILVNKFPFEIGEPNRWDVCVFKFPEDPERNYIKRLVGLPGETIRVQRGDVYARKGDNAEFKILRKSDPNKQLAIQILVADDTKPPSRLLELGWPERWAGMEPEEPNAPAGEWRPAPAAVKADPERRSYSMTAKDWTWLRYRHYVPTDRAWEAAAAGIQMPEPSPQLVTDFYAYNSFDMRRSEGHLFWVGDLTVSGQADITDTSADNAALLLELVEGVRRYHCEIDLKTGMATFSHTDDLNPEGDAIVLGTVPTPMQGTGRFRFDFANVDDRLSLWINHRLIPLGKKAEYVPPALPDPQSGDLRPIGLAARGASVTFSELLVRRDIYYRADQDADAGRNRLLNHQETVEVTDYIGEQLNGVLSDPAEYARIYTANAHAAEFNELQDAEYFMMGDNSPESLDSRLWSNHRGAVNRHAVPRNAFVGKAFLIYWPHGIPFLNGGRGFTVMNHTLGRRDVENYPAYTFPFYPQFGRLLKRIR